MSDDDIIKIAIQDLLKFRDITDTKNRNFVNIELSKLLDKLVYNINVNDSILYIKEFCKIL